MAINERRTIRLPDALAGRHRLSRSVRGVHPEAVAGDLLLAGDLNRLVVEERYGLGGDLKATANADASALTPQGFRVFGSGIAQADSGLIGGGVNGGCDLRSSAGAGDVAAIGTAVVFQPDLNGPVRASCLIEVDDLTDVAVFFGFCGAAADGMTERVTGAGTTVSLTDDDLAGLYFDSGLTAGAALLTPHNKGDAAASQEAGDIGAGGLTVDDDVKTLWTLELDRDGSLFWSSEQLGGASGSGHVPGALDADEEHALVLSVASQGAAARNLRVYALGVDARYAIS